MEEPKVKKAQIIPLKNEYGYFLLENVRVENQRNNGFTIEDHECWGYTGFLETAQVVLKKKKNLVATYQPGASKCNVKKLNQIYFKNEELRATVLYGRLMHRLGDGRGVYVLENIQLKNKENTQSQGTIDCQDLDEAFEAYIEVINNAFEPNCVATFGKYVKRIVWKNINDVETDDVEGLSAFMIGKEINQEILDKENEENQRIQDKRQEDHQNRVKEYELKQKQKEYEKRQKEELEKQLQQERWQKQEAEGILANKSDEEEEDADKENMDNQKEDFKNKYDWKSLKEAGPLKQEIPEQKEQKKAKK